MRPIDADALVKKLLEGGIYPVVVKRAIEKASTLKPEDFHKAKLQRLVNYPTATNEEVLYMCTKCTAKHAGTVRYCSFCGAFIEEILEE